MRFLQKLTIYLTISCLAIDNLKAEIPSAFNVNVNSDSLTFTLPFPEESKPQKYIVKFSDNNGFICHNYFREKQIKDKLFELKTNNSTIPDLETMVFEEKPISIFEKNTLSMTLAGVIVGILAGFFISRK